jgi:chitinase
MLGVDFDFEAGQSQSVIDSLNQRVKVSQAQFPRLRFSFSLATLGGNSSQNLGSIGVTVMNSIKSAGLTHYTINLTE